MHFCVDHKKLNAMMVQDIYPLARIDKCIGLLGDAAISSAADEKNGYQQIATLEADRDIAIFCSHHRLLRFR